MKLPIDMDILQKRQEIPVKIAQLSYKDEQQAIQFIRLWGEKRIAISEIHAQLTTTLKRADEVKTA